MKKIVFALALLLSLSMLFTVGSSAYTYNTVWRDSGYDVDPSAYAYTFVAIGDQQILAYVDAGGSAKEGITIPSSWKNQNYLDKMYQWIVDNKESKKIEFVFGLGDVTESINLDSEWTLAKNASAKLNGVVPYSIARGNHDAADSFRKYFASGNKVYRQQFDGSFGDSMMNVYKTVKIKGINYLMITLNCDPNDSEINWACRIIEAHPKHRVIISTHSYLATGGELANYVTSLKGPNSGVKMWEKLVSKYENVFMVLSGHTGYGDRIDYSVKTGVKGNKVHQFLINPQDIDLHVKPLGLVALFHFSADGESVRVEYYSTLDNKYIKMDKVIDIDPYPYLEETPPETTAAITTAAETTAAEQTTEALETTTLGVSPADKNGCRSTLFVSVLPVTLFTGAGAILGRKKVKNKK